MTETERITIVRGILLALTSSSGVQNELQAPKSDNRYRYRRDQTGTMSGRCRTKYAFIGKRLCSTALCVVANLLLIAPYS